MISRPQGLLRVCYTPIGKKYALYACISGWQGKEE